MSTGALHLSCSRRWPQIQGVLYHYDYDLSISIILSQVDKQDETLMEACFDPATLTTLYTRHTLRGPTLKAAVQKIRVRPYKNVEKVYGNVNPEILYKKVKKREYIHNYEGL